ncbi:MAG: cupin domain-containing protein [Pyrinomonadaceae bacterium]
MSNQFGCAYYKHAAEYEIKRWAEIYAPNPAMLRMQLANDGFDVFQWCDAPDRFYGNHKHDEEQSHWIVSGTLEITVENVGTFELGPGDRDSVPAGTYHSACVIGEDPVIYLVGVKKKA